MKPVLLQLAGRQYSALLYTDSQCIAMFNLNCGWIAAYSTLPFHTSCAIYFCRERASGMYRLSAFFFARMASDLPMDFAGESLSAIPPQ